MNVSFIVCADTPPALVCPNACDTRASAFTRLNGDEVPAVPSRDSVAIPFRERR